MTSKILPFLFIIVLAIVLIPSANALNVSIGNITINGTDTYYDANFSSVSIPTSIVPITNLLISNQDTGDQKDLSSISIPTNKVPITNLFISNQDTEYQKNLSIVSIPTNSVPLTNLFISNQDTDYQKDLSSVSIPSNLISIQNIFISNADVFSKENLVPRQGSNQHQPPIASFTYLPNNPIANQTIIFDASNSTDPDGTITNYKWDFGDAATGFGKVTTHSYANNRTYNVTLTVTDDDDATDTTTKEITIVGAEDKSGTSDQSSFRLYHSTIDDEINIEIYGPFEPGLNTKVNYEVLITPTNQAGGPIHSGKVYFAYPDNNTNIYPVELWFKTCVDHNWYRIDMAEDFSRNEWINLGVDTLMSMGTGIPGLWGIAKMLLGPSYPTPPEGTAYFDDNAYDSIIIPYHPIGRKVPNSLLSIAPGEGVRVIIPVEFTQRRTTDLHFFINTQILSEPICHHTRDIVIYINAGR